MIYSKQDVTRGGWINAKDIQSGMQAALVSETNPQESEYQGKQRTRDVSKIKIKGFNDAFNIGINKTSINALVDAFGGDSKNWINKLLTIEVDKTTIGGKRISVLYLVPDGYELKEDENNYLVIKKIGSVGKKELALAPEEVSEETSEKVGDMPF